MADCRVGSEFAGSPLCPGLYPNLPAVLVGIFIEVQYRVRSDLGLTVYNMLIPTIL
jgi:hypothetical protein